MKFKGFHDINILKKYQKELVFKIKVLVLQKI